MVELKIKEAQSSSHSRTIILSQTLVTEINFHLGQIALMFLFPINSRKNLFHDELRR
jgi:hypothetical protein